MRLAIVVPCYNEEEVLRETALKLNSVLSDLIRHRKISRKSRIYFVDDGSKDKTWEVIESLAFAHKQISGIRLSRNRGHQNAILAGLFTAEGDAIVSIDADLQDDVSAISRMVDEYAKGIDIVYGVRKNRDTDTWFKKSTVEMFYAFMKSMGVEVVSNHADFRLMSRRAVETLKGFKEVNLFLRGIVPLIGYRTSLVYYDRVKRVAGVSKYPFLKMIAFAVEGITSFSVVPLRSILVLGILTFIGAMLISVWIVLVKLFSNQAVPGWASTVLPLVFLGGIQILCIGIIGEYLGKTYGETKARPKYFIDSIV
jgi:glycosyltransferase involved in cell wall biosynthesis